MKLSERDIVSIVSRLVQTANRELPQDVETALLAAREREESQTGRLLLDIIVENAGLARQTGLPICQDTGIDVVSVQIGQEFKVEGDLIRAINEGIAQGTREGYLRCSVCDPITRKNTGDNTPAVIHVEPVAGDSLEISVLPKGCGSENMSATVMLPPSAGEDGIVGAVANQVLKAGPNPCPPGIIGIGIGGTMEKAALLAKKALLRPVGSRNPRDDLAELEDRIFVRINGLGIGPLGLGGSVTSLGVAVEVFPCHIASLPVAINIQCHAARHCTAKWSDGSWVMSQGSRVMGHYPQSFAQGVVRIELPLSKSAIRDLRAGDWVLLNGVIYTGRDQTHRRLVEMLDRGDFLPVDLRGQLIYYVGPSPAPPGRPVGSAGPTTSYRMDAYTPRMLAEGVLATMGKGRRSPEVKAALKEYGAVYFATTGGAGAYLASCIESCELIAFPELGPEALYRMKVKDFPAIVINDITGADFYEIAIKQHKV
ncbi:MAG: fumarate hydratase [Deltaproteobacteria bacterium]|uniref:Fumarate hydratase n=1 Tax=Candidatus Methanogaster sp. TaxID=3386292 RepID=A0AC61L137_9EURY|nr:MAG: fumarate hydratase [ANME-2 cluster archaeon]PXF60312.1 MAG: fumarate hydratase [Deltaproteobacteria bacterium]